MSDGEFRIDTNDVARLVSEIALGIKTRVDHRNLANERVRSVTVTFAAGMPIQSVTVDLEKLEKKTESAATGEVTIWEPYDDALSNAAPCWQKEIERAIIEYVKDGDLSISWAEGGPWLRFNIGEPLTEHENRKPLRDILMDEFKWYAPARHVEGLNWAPEADEPDEFAERIALMQALIRAYDTWAAEYKHEPPQTAGRFDEPESTPQKREGMA